MNATDHRPSSEVGRIVTGRRVAAGAVLDADFTYSVVDVGQIAGLGGERRNEERLRTRLRDGLVAERRGSQPIACRIRDRSRYGARLQLDKDRPLPKVFVLTDAGTRMIYWANLIWQTGRNAGVKLKLLNRIV